MDCQDARERMLQSVDEDRTRPSDIQLDAHLAGCSACARFAARQNALDARLSAMLRPPELSPGFRAALRRRIRNDSARLWPAALPEVVHFASCGVATVACAALLPFDGLMTFAVGAAATALSFLLLMAVRDVFEKAEEQLL
jgi:predicted anti-sigma-YlaC factor YlaD